MRVSTLRRGRRLPQLARGEPGALDEAGELGTDDVGIDGGLAHPRPEAAVRPGDDPLSADEPRQADESARPSASYSWWFGR